LGIDSSDQIRFTVGPSTLVPEPGTLPLLLTALAAGGFGLLWREGACRFRA